jgi:molecular chaperone DnaK (HSP70)
MTIAIDFGTSNTVITRWNPATDSAETISIPGLTTSDRLLPPLIPSLVYLQNAQQPELFLGQQVLDRGLDIQSDRRFFRGFKRGVGAEIRGFVPDLDGEKITADRVGELFLTGIMAELQKNRSDLDDSLILTVPVDSFEIYRRWLAGVFTQTRIDRVRLIDEPTAAALGYGVAGAETILVVDFGGGTLDLSLVQLSKQVSEGKTPIGFLLKWGSKSLTESAQKPQLARVIAKSGQNLGGTDLDRWIVAELVEVQGVKSSPLIARLAERMKISLSTQTTARESYFDDEELESYQLNLTRDRFNQILAEHQFFDRLDESMNAVLQQARRQGIEPKEIEAVLLVGGTSQIPAVKDWLDRYFPDDKIRQSKPFEAIAQGALQLDRGIEVEDFLYHSYGIRYWDRKLDRHNWHPIIPTGQFYPMPEPIELLLGASIANQPSIELIIGELGNEVGGTEVFFDGDRLITRPLTGGARDIKPLNDRDGARSIAQLDPLGFPGSDRIKVEFKVDRDRQLCITVTDLLTSQILASDRVVAQLT